MDAFTFHYMRSIGRLLMLSLYFVAFNVNKYRLAFITVTISRSVNFVLLHAIESVQLNCKHIVFVCVRAQKKTI